MYVVGHLREMIEGILGGCTPFTYVVFRYSGCTAPKISCDVYRCLPAEFRCDGVKQCQDGFDEHGCGKKGKIIR